MQHIKRLTEPSEGGTAGLAEEFRKLSNPNQARRLKQGTGSLTHNRSKNRLANILPCKRLAQAGKVIFILALLPFISISFKNHLHSGENFEAQLLLQHFS